MPQFQGPRSHVERIYFLGRAASTGQADITAGRAYISQTTVDAINAMLPNYTAAFTAIPAAAAGRSKEIREKNEAIAKVSTFTRDLWEVLRRRVIRNNEPVEVLQYYGLPLDGVSPKPSAFEDWLGFASTCVTGDAAAVLAGHAAMANPSAAEVNTVLTSARTEAGEVALADRTHDLALEATDGFVVAADTLITEVMDELRFNNRKMDFPSQRRVQRTYGARFYSIAGEQSEGDQRETIATGDDTQAAFSATLLNVPIEAGTISATDGLEIFTDTDNGNGTGKLLGSAGGLGTVDYSTGNITLNFKTAPVLDAAIVVDYVGGVR